MFSGISVWKLCQEWTYLGCDCINHCEYAEVVQFSSLCSSFLMVHPHANFVWSVHLGCFYNPHRGSKMHCKQYAHTTLHSNQAKYAVDRIDVEGPGTYEMGLLVFCLLCVIIMADSSDSSMN